MPIRIIYPEPEDFLLEDPIHIDRWMCSICGLIFDYKFEPGEEGWPKFEPPLHVEHYWVDEAGEYQFEEPDRTEFCPRCNISFEDRAPTLIIVREVKIISDFVEKGEGESETLEFKRDFATDRIRHAIAAFATTKGGRIILGIEDDGTQAGYDGAEDITTSEGRDALQQRIRGLLGNFSPKKLESKHIL